MKGEFSMIDVINLIIDAIRPTLHDIIPFLILLSFIGIQFQLRYEKMAYKYINIHKFYFASSFIAIYIGVGLYYGLIENYIPKKLADTGITLAIYLIFIGVLIEIIHKCFYDAKKNIIDKIYVISECERIFIICICMVILCIIGLFNESGNVLKIVAILLGKIFWIDTGIVEHKNTDSHKFKTGLLVQIKKMKERILEGVKKIKARIREIGILIIISEAIYYILRAILMKYPIGKNVLVIVFILPMGIGLLIMIYGKNYKKYIESKKYKKEPIH